MSNDQPIRIINVYGAKGGVGTSTITVALAWLARGAALSDDACAIAGIVEHPDTPNVASFTEGHDARTIVVDQGVLEPTESVKNGDTQVLVLRNDYLSLRRATTLIDGVTPQGDLVKTFDYVICTYDSQRPIAQRDIEHVVGMPVILVPDSPIIARAIDAGLLVTRFPRDLMRLGALANAAETTA